MTLRMDNVSVVYRDSGHDLLALDRVDLTLEPGRINALVGESGSGKTTLAKTVMGLLPDYAEMSGSVVLDETELTDLDEVGLNRIRWSRISMVFQNGAANLNPVHRIIDQVAEPLIQHGHCRKREAREQASCSLERMGLKRELADRFPHELSGGEVQRALLAMALIMDPDVLILDEPTSALDAMTRMFVARIIRSAAGNGIAVLLISHDLELAERLADDVSVLYMGQVMESMAAKDLFLNPRHPYTLALGRSFPGMDTLRDLGGIRGDAFYRIRHRHAREDNEADSHSHLIVAGSHHEEAHAPPSGCLFQARCTQAVAECLDQDVALQDIGGHRIRCLRGGIVDRIVLKGVSKQYNGVSALHPTDLSLQSGEVFCLVGETGSGKTTLAMITAGFSDLDQGHRLFDGRDMETWRKQDYQSLAKQIGVVYQNPAEAVSHRLTVFDIVAEPLRIQGTAQEKQEIETRVKNVLADVRLSTETAFLKRYPHELNMGAIQRLCIARALVLEPSLLVADEPTSSLDPSVQAKVLKLLLDLQIEKGLTMLFVTHDIGLARKVADRIGVMLDGILVEMGPAARVLNKPLHPYTKRLLESAAGNLDAAADTRENSVPATGCPFSPRCETVVSACLSKMPHAVTPNGPHHPVRCFRPHTLII